MEKKTNIIRAILIILGGAIFIIYAFPSIIFVNIATIIGSTFGALLIILGVFLQKFIALCKSLCKSKLGKSTLFSVLSIFLVCIIALGSAMGSVVACSDTNADGQDTLIVLGCFVKNGKPSYSLTQRINACYDYLVSNPKSVAVLSGGQGSDEIMSEAKCMYDVLVQKGINPDRLYMEDKSTNTNENIKYSLEIIETEKLSKNIAVVSNDYHLKRSTMIAKKQGVEVKRISAGSTLLDKPNFYLREGLGVIKEFIF